MVSNDASLPVNPLVKELLEAGERVLAVDGYIGPSERDKVQLYRDLSLITSVEIARKDILRVETLPGRSDGRVRLYVRVSAELRLVTAVTLKGSDVLAAAATSGASSGGCGCGSAEPGTSERVNPPDNCYGHCEIFRRLCVLQHFGELWCALAYAGCVTTCSIIDMLPLAAEA
jgi:hypothetical protein